MNVFDAHDYVTRHGIVRGECRDLTFGDTEIFLTFEDGTDVGGGYFSRSAKELWLTANDQHHHFIGNDADMLRKLIPLKSISRNDNEGVW
jgi:hypothetical protein